MDDASQLRDDVAGLLRRGLTEIEIERRLRIPLADVRRLVSQLTSGADVERCPVCGSETVGQRCKASCPRCGYWRSCADP
jgi:rubrerythrin